MLGNDFDTGDEDLVTKRIVRRPRTNDIEAIQPEAFQGQLLRTGSTRRIGVFYLEASPLVMMQEQQIQLTLIVDTPEINLILFKFGKSDNLLQCKSFPRGTQTRICRKANLILNAQQMVQNSTVAKIYFRRLNFPFFQVFVPGPETSHHESSGQNVQIATCGGKHRIFTKGRLPISLGSSAFPNGSRISGMLPS